MHVWLTCYWCLSVNRGQRFMRFMWKLQSRNRTASCPKKEFHCEICRRFVYLCFLAPSPLPYYEYFISPFHYPILHYPRLPLSCRPSLSCSLTAAPPSLVFLLLCLGNVCSHVPDPVQEPLFVSFSPVSRNENHLCRRSAEVQNPERRACQSRLCYHETDFTR